MAIAVRHQRGQRQIVVGITDTLDAGAVRSLRRALVRALRTRYPILIDLSGATSISPDALTALVAAYRHAERTGSQLLLRTGPTHTRAVLAAFGVPPQRCTALGGCVDLVAAGVGAQSLVGEGP